MHGRLARIIPIIVASAALTFSASTSLAQAPGDGAAGSAAEKCACCQKSGGAAMQHGSATGNAAPAAAPAADAVDHAALGHIVAAPAAEPKAPPAHSCSAMASNAGKAGCCSHAAATTGDQKKAAGCAMCASHGKTAAADASSTHAGCAMCAAMHAGNADHSGHAGAAATQPDVDHAAHSSVTE